MYKSPKLLYILFSLSSPEEEFRHFPKNSSYWRQYLKKNGKITFFQNNGVNKCGEFRNIDETN